MPTFSVVTGGSNDEAILNLLSIHDGKTRFELAQATALSIEEVNRTLARLTAARLAHLQVGLWYRRPQVARTF